MSDQLVAETSTFQHTTLTTDRHPYPWWDSNPQSQQASGRRLTPQKARSLGPAIIQGYYKRNRHFQLYVVSPDLTPCDFFLWRYTKDRIFVPPLPVSLNKLKQRITTAVASVDEDMLRSVWTELDYRIDICRVIKGSHIEHF